MTVYITVLALGISFCVSTTLVVSTLPWIRMEGVVDIVSKRALR